MCDHPGFSKFPTFSLSSSAVWLEGGLWLLYSVSMFLKLILFSASIQKSLIRIEKGNTRCLVGLVDEICLRGGSLRLYSACLAEWEPKPKFNLSL